MATVAMGNRRLPGDLLGRWTRLYKTLDAMTTEDDPGIDMSDLVVLNAYLTEDAEFEKWQGGTWDATPTPALSPQTVAVMREALESEREMVSAKLSWLRSNKRQGSLTVDGEMEITKVKWNIDAIDAAYAELDALAALAQG